MSSSKGLTFCCCDFFADESPPPSPPTPSALPTFAIHIVRICRRFQLVDLPELGTAKPTMYELIRPVLERWAGVAPLHGTAIYGVRIYTSGAILQVPPPPSPPRQATHAARTCQMLCRSGCLLHAPTIHSQGQTNDVTKRAKCTKLLRYRCIDFINACMAAFTSLLSNSLFQ